MERKKAAPLISLEAHAKGLLKGGADGVEGWRVACSFHSRQAVPRVGRKEPSQDPWVPR